MSEGGNLGLFAALAAPFEPGEVRSRNQGGRELSYVTARTVMNRLDEVLGVDGWWDDYQPIDNAAICRLTIRLPDGRTITKVDVGGNSQTNDPSDCEKSGMSDAFKRAAVKFGVGRYLYGDGVPQSIRDSLNASRRPAASEHPDYDGPPPDDYDYRPDPRPRQSAPPQQPRRDNGNGVNYAGSVPRSGKALFAWSKEQGDKARKDVIAVVNDFGKSRGWADRMVQWTDSQVAEAHAEAAAFLAHANGVGGHD